MARNTIQKKFVETYVYGVVVENGELRETVYTVEGRVNINSAQAAVRRENSSFTAMKIQHVERLYKMTFDEFKQHATLCCADETDEADEADGIDEAN